MIIALLLDACPVQDRPACTALRAGDASLGRADAQCQVSQLASGVEQSSCYWAFAAAGEQGRMRFDELNRLIERCFPQMSLRPPVPGVNHPDSYDQRIYEGLGQRISLSLKKKGALGQSFVFLGVSPLR